MNKITFSSLVAAMALTILTSNILVQFLLGDWLTWAAFTYPIAFLITDVSNRLYGPHTARKVVLVGFVTGLVCSMIASQFTNADGIPYTTFRIALGSGLAFLAAQLTDVFVFDKLRKLDWWKAPAVSSIIGSLLDTAVFFSVAFAAVLTFIEPSNDTSWATEMIPLLGFGFLAPLWVSLAVADFFVKMFITAVALVPFRSITKRAEIQ